MKNRAKLFLPIYFLLATVCANAQTPAFPGAEGHGRYTSGGRGGKTVRVTNLRDNAGGESVIAGSLRWALQQASPKTIIFDVSGTIELKQKLSTAKDNITIAGQSAPGDGICISGYAFAINSNNVIIRFIRFRPGDISREEPDGLGGMDKKNILIDHCSVSWSVDECLSVYGCENLSVQWCIVSEALRVSTHEKGTHGYGGNWGGNKASYHHNLIAHCESRAPRLGPRPSTQQNEYVDIRNNVFYNWAGNGCYGGEGMKVNMVNNYYKPGPATAKASSAVKYRITKIGIRTTAYVTGSDGKPNEWKPMEHVWGKFFIEGNKIEGNSAVTADNWTKGVYEQISDKECDNLYTSKTKDTIRLHAPLETGTVTTHTPDEAFKQILQYAGCSLHRDETDERIISDTRDGKATFTASGNKPGYINSQDDTKPAGATSDWNPWPLLRQAELPADSDKDGIPDAWEEVHGLNKNLASDANQKNNEGYTYLEVYLNSLVEAIINNQNGTQGSDMVTTTSHPSGLVAFASGGAVHFRDLPADSLVSIFSIGGSLIRTIEAQGSELSCLLPGGTYITQVTSRESTEVRKLIIM